MSSSFLFGIQFIRSYAEGTISRKPTPYFETPQFQDILDNNSFKAMKPNGSNMEEPWFSGDNGTNPVVRMFVSQVAVTASTGVAASQRGKKHDIRRCVQKWGCPPFIKQCWLGSLL